MNFITDISTKSKCFIIGNGESRKDFDLSSLKGKGIILGCNALYREFEPDILVSVDRGITAEIQASGYVKTHKVFVRYPQACPDGSYLKDYIGARTDWAAGPCCLELAATAYRMGFATATIYMLGFDLYGTADGFLNNIYKDSPHYRPSKHQAISHRNWVRQIGQNIQENNHLVYKKVGDVKDKVPKEWEPYKDKNLFYISYEDFKKELS